MFGRILFWTTLEGVLFIGIMKRRHPYCHCEEVPSVLLMPGGILILSLRGGTVLLSLRGGTTKQLLRCARNDKKNIAMTGKKYRNDRKKPCNEKQEIYQGSLCLFK
jgi:hypothetical protein